MSVWIYNDGGRAAAGFKGTAGDCVCRAIAIATGRDYKYVYDGLNRLAKVERASKRRRGQSASRTGMHRVSYEPYLLARGWVWVPTMGFGTGCRVHLTASELPSGRLIVAVSRHLVAVIDGTVHDTFDCTRGGQRCVYGYYHKP